MNKKIIVASLANIANKLDSNKLYTKANEITKIMVKIAQEEDPGQDTGLDDHGLNDTRKRIDKFLELQTKIKTITNLDELYTLKNQLLNNPSFRENETSDLVDDINAKIIDLEYDVLHKFEQMISKPYFESNIAKFKAMGQAIESNPEFKTLNKNTQQKIRSYYFNLDKKIQTRVQEREKIPLLNSDAMINKPDQISNFVIKNMQYEINKIINKKTFEPIMQEYLSNFLESETLSESEFQRQRNHLIKLYFPTYVNQDGSINDPGNIPQLKNISRFISDPKNVGVKQSIKVLEQRAIVDDLMDEFSKFQQMANTILENAKEYARTKSEKNFKPLQEITVPRVDFAPSRTINNLNTFINNNAKSLSKSVSDANKLLAFANDALQKVESVLSGTVNPDPNAKIEDLFTSPLFALPQTDEEMQKFINRPDTPLYPGSRPPEQ
jgi:hypothetical protein